MIGLNYLNYWLKKIRKVFSYTVRFLNTAVSPSSIISLGRLKTFVCWLFPILTLILIFQFAFVIKGMWLVVWDYVCVRNVNPHIRSFTCLGVTSCKCKYTPGNATVYPLSIIHRDENKFTSFISVSNTLCKRLQIWSSSNYIPKDHSFITRQPSELGTPWCIQL